MLDGNQRLWIIYLLHLHLYLEGRDNFPQENWFMVVTKVSVGNAYIFTYTLKMEAVYY